MASSDYTAHTLSVNDISSENIITGGKAIALEVLRLILLEPGINSLFPEMGCGIRIACAGKTEKDIPDLQDMINEQVDEYLPQYQAVTVELGMDATNKALLINITVDNTTYIYNTSTESSPIYLSNL